MILKVVLLYLLPLEMLLQLLPLLFFLFGLIDFKLYFKFFSTEIFRIFLRIFSALILNLPCGCINGGPYGGYPGNGTPGGI